MKKYRQQETESMRKVRIWKGRAYWQKGAIIFGAIHLALFAIECCNIPQGEGGLGLFLLELPLALLLMLLGMDLFFFSKPGYYYLIFWGTLGYALVGAVLGIIIGGIIGGIARISRKRG